VRLPLLKHEDQEAHEILLLRPNGAFLTDENRMSLRNFELHVYDPRKHRPLGQRTPRGYHNNAEIAVAATSSWSW